MAKAIYIYSIAWRLLTLISATIATSIIPFQKTYTAFNNYGWRFPYLIMVFANFDGYHYMSIAQNGYKSFQYPFMPLYPFLIRLVDHINPLPLIIEAQFISLAAFILALIVITKLLKIDGVQRLFHLMMLVIILYPTSFFYGAVYNDSLFLLMAVLCIYFTHQRNWPVASLFGALATLTRLNGLGLFLLIIFEYLFKDQTINKLRYSNILQTIKRNFTLTAVFQSKIYLALLIPLAFIGYLLYIQLAYGDWNLVFSSMQVWHQDKLTFPLQVVWRYFKIIVLHPELYSLSYWVALIEAIFVGLYTFFLIWSWNKIRFSYWIFFFLSILIPSLTGTFEGMPRYGLHIYPFFLALTLFLSTKPRWVKIVYFTFSLALFFILIGLFTRGYFVS